MKLAASTRDAVKAELALKKHLVDKFMQEKATHGGLLKPPPGLGTPEAGSRRGSGSSRLPCPCAPMLRGSQKGGMLGPCSLRTPLSHC